MKTLALCLLLLGCGPTIDYPDCNTPKEGDSCAPSGSVFEVEGGFLVSCNSKGRISRVAYLVYDINSDIQRYTVIDSPCFDDESCYLLSGLCR